MKAIIFGSNGQDGYYLKKLLAKKNVYVIDVSRKNATAIGDVSEYKFVESLIKTEKPDYIFHFAANSTTAHYALFENHNTISTGTLNILESVKQFCPATRVFISGSAMQFKNIGKPINENTPFDASSPYSIARIQSVYASRYYRAKFGLNVYVGYFFNHDSPLRSERHINQKIAQTALRIKNGSSEKLEIGNIEVEKEFNFAGDLVEAVWLLVNQNKIFETIIGSGKAYKIKDWIKICFEKLDLNWQEHIIFKEGFKAGYKKLVSKPIKLFMLGYKPTVSIEFLSEMMINNEI